jgi:hypothetical protein
MKHKGFDTLILLVLALSLFSCFVGLFLNTESNQTTFTSLHGQAVTLHGFGLYRLDSVSVASQGIAQDVITLTVAIPMLFLSWIHTRKFSLKGSLILLGTLGYFLYTYVSYVFLWMLNPLFVVYVALMSLSFFAFIWLFTQFDIKQMPNVFSAKLPRNFLGSVQILLGVMLLLIWSSMIIQYMIFNQVPVGLDHYTTLVIQGLDLGFIVPISILSGILLIRGKPLGFMLSSIVIIKGFTMGLAIMAMIIGQYLAGVNLSIVEVSLFFILSLFLIVCLILLIKHIKTHLKSPIFKQAHV